MKCINKEKKPKERLIPPTHHHPKSKRKPKAHTYNPFPKVLLLGREREGNGKAKFL